MYPPRRSLAEGWTNKAQVQDGIAPTNDTDALPTQSMVEGQRNPRLMLVGACHSTQQCWVGSSWKDPDIGLITEMEGVRPETIWSQSMCLKPCNQALLDLLGPNHLQFIVPRSLHNEILHHSHDSLLGGHLGQKKTREKALQRFCWCGFGKDCNNCVAKCDECAMVKDPQKSPCTLGGVTSTI